MYRSASKHWLVALTAIEMIDTYWDNYGFMNVVYCCGCNKKDCVLRKLNKPLPPPCPSTRSVIWAESQEGRYFLSRVVYDPRFITEKLNPHWDTDIKIDSCQKELHMFTHTPHCRCPLGVKLKSTLLWCHKKKNPYLRSKQILCFGETSVFSKLLIFSNSD